MIEGTLIAESMRVGAELAEDVPGRAEAMAYGRSVGVPEDELDWPT